MLPLYLLTSIKGQAIMVELKSGETINGTLNNCDSWMNLTLDDAITADTHGANFSKLKEVYIRGNQIKYMRMSNEIIDKFKEQQQQQQQQPYNSSNNYHHGNNSQGGQRYHNYNNNSQAGQGQRYNSNSDNRGGYGQRRNYNNQGRGQHQSRGGNYQHRDSNTTDNDK